MKRNRATRKTRRINWLQKHLGMTRGTAKVTAEQLYHLTDKEFEQWLLRHKKT